MALYERIYAAVVKEDVPPGFRSHVFMLRITEDWPTATDRHWYKWLTITFFAVVGIIFPFTQFVNIFYANSIEEGMDQIFTPLTCWTTTFKAAIFYVHQKSIKQIFRIHQKLLRRAGNAVEYHEHIARSNFHMHICFTLLYLMTWAGYIIQVSLSKPEDAFFSSTSRFPYAIAQRREVYMIMLVYQALCSLGIGIWASTQDTFYIGLINVICGHVTQLKQRLTNLGIQTADCGSSDSRFYSDVVDCCKCYEECLW